MGAVLLPRVEAPAAEYFCDPDELERVQLSVVAEVEDVEQKLTQLYEGELHLFGWEAVFFLRSQQSQILIHYDRKERKTEQVWIDNTDPIYSSFWGGNPSLELMDLNPIHQLQEIEYLLSSEELEFTEFSENGLNVLRSVKAASDGDYIVERFFDGDVLKQVTFSVSWDHPPTETPIIHRQMIFSEPVGFYCGLDIPSKVDITSFAVNGESRSLRRRVDVYLEDILESPFADPPDCVAQLSSGLTRYRFPRLQEPPPPPRSALDMLRPSHYGGYLFIASVLFLITGGVLLFRSRRKAHE